jgi:hypothetical protein
VVGSVVRTAPALLSDRARDGRLQVLRVLPRQPEGGDQDARLWANWTPTPKPAVAVLAVRAAVPAAAAAPASVPIAPSVVVPAPPFRVLGRYADEAGEGVVLIGADGNVVLARAGDKPHNDYQVESISGNLMVLSYLPLNQKQAIDIGIAK